MRWQEKRKGGSGGPSSHRNSVYPTTANNDIIVFRERTWLASLHASAHSPFAPYVSLLCQSMIFLLIHSRYMSAYAPPLLIGCTESGVLHSCVLHAS